MCKADLRVVQTLTIVNSLLYLINDQFKVQILLVETF